MTNIKLLPVPDTVSIQLITVVVDTVVIVSVLEI
jgi:hypothetical protein